MLLIPLSLAGCKKKNQPPTYQVESVAVAPDHACALATSGAVFCWGKNDQGQLGDGTRQDRATPVHLDGLPPVDALWAGDGVTCARKKAPATGVECWGSLVRDGTRAPVAGDASALDKVTTIAFGASFACALLEAGTVQCWGRADFGQLGVGPTTDLERSRPGDVGGLWGVKELVAGGHHACVVVEGGEVRCWGRNRDGELGDGTTTDRDAPVVVKGVAAVVDLAAGGAHTCAVRSDRSAACWGKDDVGQLGDGSRTAHPRTQPVDVAGLEAVKSVALGEAHTCARLFDGTLRCWGANEAGQLTNGTTAPNVAPAMISGLFNVQQLVAAGSTTCARLDDKSVHCWGAGKSGQIGDGALADRAVPVVVRLHL